MKKNTLWVKVIQAIQGISGRDISSILKSKKAGTWLNIVKVGAILKDYNLNMEDFFSRKVGNGNNTFLWHDRWLGSAPLKDLFPDLLVLESNNSCSIADRLFLNENGVGSYHWSWSNSIDADRLSARIEGLQNFLQFTKLSTEEDSWRWEGDVNGSFSVKSLRSIIDNVMNSPYAGLRFWNKWLPPRVNCFMWRVLLKRLPTRVNLQSRGINIPSTSCPLCSNDSETVEHIFISCTATKVVWNWFSDWCKLSLQPQSSLEQMMFSIVDQGPSKKKKTLLEAALGCLLWCVWKARNNTVFGGKRFSALVVIDEVLTSLFTWVKYRSNCNTLVWSMWCSDPLYSL